MREIREIIILHTATSRMYSVGSIRQYHVNVRRWRDIGYHWLIDGHGHLRLGRPENLPGAHVKGRNINSIGVAVIGNFEIMEPTEEQAAGLDILLQDLLVRYPEATVHTHREYKATACPGKNLIRLLTGWNIL